MRPSAVGEVAVALDRRENGTLQRHAFSPSGHTFTPDACDSGQIGREAP